MKREKRQQRRIEKAQKDSQKQATINKESPLLELLRRLGYIDELVTKVTVSDMKTFIKNNKQFLPNLPTGVKREDMVDCLLEQIAHNPTQVWLAASVSTQTN